MTPSWKFAHRQQAFSHSLCLAALFSTIGAVAGAQGPDIPVGAEFRINAYTTGTQNFASVAMQPQGDFVVVWHSRDPDGSDYGVFVRRFDAAGTPYSGELQVNSYTTGPQRTAAIATDEQGNFVIVWRSLAQDDSEDGVYARRFDSTGAALGGEFRVNSYITGGQSFPDVAVDDQGRFLVVWESDQDGSNKGIYAQRFDSSGAPVANEFRVNSWTTDSQRFPAVASDSQGRFVVAWESDGQDGSYYGVFAQRFDASGAPLAGEFQVNSNTNRSQSRPAIATDGKGDFIIAWNSDGEIAAQRFDSDGTPLGTELQVNTYTTYPQISPSVASDSQGNFVVSWTTYYQDGSSTAVYAQRFASSGTALGSEFQVNSFTTAFQFTPSVATDEQGNFVIAWASFQDGSDLGIYSQRFETTRIGDRAWSDADLDGIQDPGEIGIGNVQIQLYDVLGTLLASTTTDHDGAYLFTAIPPDDVFLEFGLPSGFAFSPLDQGADDTVDSDADPVSGQTTPFAISAGELADTWDVGFDADQIFVDGFESGSTSAWSLTRP